MLHCRTPNLKEESVLALCLDIYKYHIIIIIIEALRQKTKIIQSNWKYNNLITLLSAL